MTQDEDFPFLEEQAPLEDVETEVWRILIVDDDLDVHQTSLLALKGLLVEGRRLEFVHAYTAAQARALLAQYDDIAVVLLDVVMESDDAGLQLVRYIREDLKNSSLRILLRTGQAGYAPEIETIRTFDINDYKMKSEMTRARLFTSLTVAIRSYWQIHQLEVGRHGLELIVKASCEFSKPQGLHLLAQGILTQLCALLGVRTEGLVCVAEGFSEEGAVVLAAAGRYSQWIGRPLSEFPDEGVQHDLRTVLANRQHLIGKSTCLYFPSNEGSALAAFIRVDKRLRALDHSLLEVFCANISVAFTNAELNKKVTDLAYKDALVGLPNRNGLLQLLDASSGDGISLALVDIDSFSDLNSVLDQSFGDSVLVSVAHRMQQVFCPQVRVARVGSDVFALLGPDSLVNPQRVSEVFSTPFHVGEEHVRLSVTTGIVHVDRGRATSAGLLRNAAVALKQCKVFTRGQALYFEPTHASAARDRMQMLSHLRLAFSAERLFVVYQPFVDLSSGKVVGAEALLRWRMEDGTFVPPDRFIPIAEQSGLMVPIGDWVLTTALVFLARLARCKQTPFRMAVNISHIQFREPDFVQKLISAIQQQGVDPENIEIELTESVAADDIRLIEEKLSAIRAYGVAVAIDDFGTGFSSLNIIRQLRVNRIKIDRAFVSGDACQNGDYGIAEMIQNLASHLGLETIAEGIETPAQREKMLAIGVRDGQGYLFSKPLTADEFEAFFLKQK